MIRILFLSFTPPLPSWGSAMTFYRHFVEQDDFVTLVATNSRHLAEYDLPYTPIQFDSPAWWNRLRNTRIHNWVMGFQNLYGAWLLPAHVMRAAREFKPDAVFTMAGSWDWVALAAQKVARRLHVPLISSFNDWYDYPYFMGHPSQRLNIEARFKRFYSESDLALCTSEGMKEALGPHRNAHVWYPTGASIPDNPNNYEPVAMSADRPLTVFFGGSLCDWYGKMLEELVSTCKVRHPHIRFRIFGGLQSWSAKFEDEVVRNGVFGGRIPYDKLKLEAENADLLLLPMGFDNTCAHIEMTSFKTKFLDYLSFLRPIVVWGPEYCSAVRIAREFDSAECVVDPSAIACADVIAKLGDHIERRKILVRNASYMYQDRFHPDKIHRLLVREISKLSKRSLENTQ